MTTFISQQAEQLAELDERTKQAWTRYTEDLRELEGTEYDAAEADSWERLQQELEEVREQRRELEQHTGSPFG